MKDPKKITLVVIMVVLLASLGVMTYMLATDSGSFSLFNLRASNSQDEIDPFLAELNISPTVVQEQSETVPSPTVTESVTRQAESSDPTLLAYNSTSPTVTPIVTGPVSPTPSVDVLTETPTPTEFIQITGDSLTPTVITELPVTGITDNIWTFLIGGGVLILLALFL